MRNPLKRTKKPPKPKKEKIYRSKDLVFLTTESSIDLVMCQVNDDHTLKYKKKIIKIKNDRPAHILNIPIASLMPTWLLRRLAPRNLLFNAYAVQKTAETTHDPHLDKLDEAQKVRFEHLIQIQAVAAKASLAAKIMAGLKGKATWWESLGALIAIVIIVAIFMFGFQVQPNL